ncbi:MAG: hypothetical protein ACRD2E_01240 [Terriglobales bacterium]
MDYAIPRFTEQSAKAIELCLRANLVLPALTLLYSAIDVVGFLDGQEQYAERGSFIAWTEKYVADFLKRKGIKGIDLYSARCGVLHTGQAPSALVDKGAARELWYEFNDNVHINIMTNTPQPAVLIDVPEFVGEFKRGTEAWINAVHSDPLRLVDVEAKVRRAFRQGKFFIR